MENIAHLFIGLGIAALVVAILVRLGFLKLWFILRSSPNMPRSFMWGFVPLGMALIVQGVSFMMPLSKNDKTMVFDIVFCPLLVLSFVFAIWKPRWLMPDWYRWIWDNHRDVIGLLRREARRDERAWMERVSTQEGLEAWVLEVRSKHNVTKELAPLRESGRPRWWREK